MTTEESPTAGRLHQAAAPNRLREIRPTPRDQRDDAVPLSRKSEVAHSPCGSICQATTFYLTASAIIEPGPERVLGVENTFFSVAKVIDDILVLDLLAKQGTHGRRCEHAQVAFAAAIEDDARPLREATGVGARDSAADHNVPAPAEAGRQLPQP